MIQFFLHNFFGVEQGQLKRRKDSLQSLPKSLDRGKSLKVMPKVYHLCFFLPQTIINFTVVAEVLADQLTVLNLALFYVFAPLLFISQQRLSSIMVLVMVFYSPVNLHV